MSTEGLPDLRAFDPHAAVLATEQFWTTALRQANELGPLSHPVVLQGGPVDRFTSAEEAIEVLRREQKACLMAFPARLGVIQLPPLAAYPGWSVWRVDVPLTLFPSRDRGFTVVDAAVQFQAHRRDSLQVLEVHPAPQDHSLAQIHLQASVSLASSLAAGIPMPLMGPEATIARVAETLDASFRTNLLNFEIVRRCLDSAALGGGRAVWRLDKPDTPLAVQLDAAKLSVEVAVAPKAGPVSAYAAAVGCTKSQWLSADLGSLYQHLCRLLGDLFVQRLPVECREEWRDLFGAGSDL